jgi:integrase
MAAKRYPGVHSRRTAKGEERFFWQFEYEGAAYKKHGYLRAKDAADAMAAKKSEVQQGIGIAEGRGATFGQVAKSWLVRLHMQAARGERRSSTVKQYERDLRNHLLPTLERRRVADVRTDVVEQLSARLTEEGLSPDTARRVVNTLGYVMRHARRHNLIAFDPVSDADKPKPRRRRPDVISLADLHRLADKMPSRETKALVLIAAYTGARKSELFALEWADVDLTEGAERLVITKQFYKGELVDQTKTRAGAREVILAPQAADVLRELSVAQQVDDRKNLHGLVFPATRGGYWRDSTFFPVWNKARTAAQLSATRMHDLRYFHISHVRTRSGLPTAVTEQLVGHTDDRTHQDYTRPVPGMEQPIREGLGRAFATSEEAAE